MADVLALPSDFAQSEALYALAGRGEIEAEVLAARVMRSPKEALEEARLLDSHVARMGAVSRIAYQWAPRDPQEAYEYVKTIENPQLRQMAQQAVINRWAAIDSDALLGYMGDSLTNGELQRCLSAFGVKYFYFLSNGRKTQ